MSRPADWKDRQVVVLGAGRSGRAAAELLAWCGARVTLSDLRDADELQLPAELPQRGVSLALGGHPESLWRAAEVVVASPGIPPDAAPLQRARQAGLTVTSEIEVAGGLTTAPAVAITGSNGKSTVTALVSAILRRAGLDAPACGNIGLALSDVVLEVLRDGRPVDRYVLELSSFQTEALVRFQPRWCAVLNISPDHLDRYRDLREYAAAKLHLLHDCGPDDWLVWGADDPWLAGHLPDTAATAVPFGVDVAGEGTSARIVDGRLLWTDPGGEPHDVMAVDDIAMLGAHNHRNACAAVALACLAGAGPEDAAATLREFAGLEHRMEPCGDIDGIACVNDSKATNPGAAEAALAGLEGPLWLVLGGRHKGSSFARLRPWMGRRTRGVLLVGEAAPRIAAALHGSAPLLRCGDLPRAVDEAAARGRPGDTLLLAPACTSFDQYRDFEERGRHFKALVAARAADPRAGG